MNADAAHFTLETHDPPDLEALERELERLWAGSDNDLTGLMQLVQAHFRYLPETALRRLAARLDVPMAQVLGVASFYDRLHLAPRGRRTLQVCTGTACHVRGAHRITDAVARHLRVTPGETSADGEFTLETVACVGCCSLAPVLQSSGETWGRLDPVRVIDLVEALRGLEPSGARAEPLLARGDGARRIRVGLGSCGLAAGGRKVWEAIVESLRSLRLEARLTPTGCEGLCYREVLVELDAPGARPCLYGNVTPERVPELLHTHFIAGRALSDLLVTRRCDPAAEGGFLASQRRVVLRNAGLVDPSSLEEYASRGGFDALRCALGTLGPHGTLREVEHSGLRGRGGAGFLTGTKWRRAREASGTPKVVVCNADEGDPGAFMDRNLLESDPFSVLEGMVIAAFAVGASEGVIYVRDEYPLALERARHAVDRCRAHGWLGRSVGGSSFGFDIAVRRGAGAFVCGEETALIAALEGHRGTPRPRPPYPVEQGLHGRPTLINNVETFANVPWIVSHGAEAFLAVGTESSAGTKVFSLAGDVRRGGMVEVPMGTTLRAILYDIGGGSRPGHTLKAVQVGGPSGGCLPASLFDMPIDYDSLRATGAIMGSGGLVGMDEGTCMVDVAHYFLAFMQRESCGRCAPCRVGTRRMLEIVDRIRAGRGRTGDLEALESLGRHIHGLSVCGLGRSAPNPVLTTLRYFRDEWQGHLEGRCPAGKCRDLTIFEIDPWRCEGCTTCLSQCATIAIHRFGEGVPLAIDPETCVRCGGCFEVCRYGAVRVRA